MAWLENDSFLLDSEVDKRQVYYYLKKNPESAKFIYRKYGGLQPIIRELCDPEDPLYLAIIGLSSFLVMTIVLFITIYVCLFSIEFQYVFN